jgi:hypothetical protein
VNRKVGNLKPGAPRVGQINRRQLEVFEVAYPITAEANEVVVMLGVSIETSHRFEVICPARNPQLDFFLNWNSAFLPELW